MAETLASQFLKCIQHERDQDIKQTEEILKTLPLSKLVANGYAIRHLTLENIRSGLAGKLYVELGPDHSITDEIARGDIKVGDTVVIKPQQSSASSSSSGRSKPRGKTRAKAGHKHKDTASISIHDNDVVESNGVRCSGVVYKLSPRQLVVAVDEQQEQDTTQLYSVQRLVVTKTANTVTYKRMESTMKRLSEWIQGTVKDTTLSNNAIIDYLLPLKKQNPPNDPTKMIPIRSPRDTLTLAFFNEKLNESQRHAIAFTLNNQISIIHGPPGTGKTYTLVELIQQLVHMGERVLVCGPSNISVDTILERLAKVMPGDKLLRIGHPARLLESNLCHSLDILSRSGSRGAIIADIYNDIDRTIKDIKRTKNYKDRKAGWQEVKELRRELRVREQRVIKELILDAKVVVATLHGSGSKELCSVYKAVGQSSEPTNEEPTHVFDTLIIDEVSQSLEPQCWIPLVAHCKSNIKRLVLAGDNKQLPPTIKTEDDPKVKVTLETTLFDRLVKQYGDSFRKLLDTQYRMNDKIMEFPSREMYGGKLIAAESVRSGLLTDLPGVKPNDDTCESFIWYHTQGEEFYENEIEIEGGGSAGDVKGGLALAQSRYNENEALLVKRHVVSLIKSGVPSEDIGIITPYSAQVATLKSLISEVYPNVEISTVDGFQGREKEVIVLSLVRSNDKFEVGFLKEERRLNVAMTRPKRQLCVIGNIETLQRSGNKYLKDWASWGEEHADIRYPSLDDIL